MDKDNKVDKDDKDNKVDKDDKDNKVDNDDEVDNDRNQTSLKPGDSVTSHRAILIQPDLQGHFRAKSSFCT